MEPRPSTGFRPKHGKPTVISAAACILAGAGAAACMPSLPDARLIVAGMMPPLTFLLYFGWHSSPRRMAWWLTHLSLWGLAFGWAMLRGNFAMQARLPPWLEGRDLLVEGQLIDLPRLDPDAWRFGFRVDQAHLDGRLLAWHGQTRLAWYTPKPATMLACSHWRLLLRLRRPRGLLNPDGIDSERSALERGIDAVGYVRASSANRTLISPWCVDSLRARIASAIADQGGAPRDIALLQAFSVGDARGLSEMDWMVARANGIPHLIAISGFHIGIAAIFAVLLLRAVYMLFPRLGERYPRSLAGALLSFPSALAYGVLAGLSLPTVRTLLMIAALAAAHAWRRRGGGGHALALAALVIVVLDPLAVLSAGFWMSFLGVALLMLCLHARGHGWRAWLRELIGAQCLMSLALLPLSLWFFGEASLIGGLSNLLAEPLVSFLIVPLALAGVLGFLLWPAVSMPCWGAARWLIHLHWWLLERMAAWPGAHWHPPHPSPLSVLFAVLGAVWLFMPRGTPLRMLAPLLWLSLLSSRPAPLAAGAFELRLLDVGQGLSVLLRTREHMMVYDAGARYRSGFDLGAAVVVPNVLALGMDNLDVLLISHGDNDHAGGAAAVARAFPMASGLAGEPERTHPRMRACLAGQRWRWDGVDFLILQPASSAVKNNDQSCVLLVSGTGGRALLTGDIDAALEPALADAMPPGPPPVLLVPHHGSKYSSSAEFLRELRPRLALVSAGWHNRFGHPHPLVTERYRAIGADLLNTAESGAIIVSFPVRDKPLVVAKERWRRRAYWREP